MGEGMKSVIRAFIAIELSDDIHHRLDDVEHQIQSRAGETARRAVRWVAAENIHLTLKFLGDVSTDQLTPITGLLAEVAASYPGLDLTIGGSGAFPNARRPRVVWVGCEGSPVLGRLQKAVDQAMDRLGYPREERPFSPHLTLGRVNENARGDELAQLVRALGETHVGELGRVKVETFHLFKSELHPGGAVYTRLNTFRLGGG
jgi:RNA 2',3'-cyclic 3'-phosphodiesterase